MKTKQLLIIFSLFVTIQGIAQYYTPQSPILIPESNLDKSSIVQTLDSERVLFTPIDIEELRLDIRKSNNAVENEISLIKSKISNLFMDKQELLQLKDIKKINEVIAEKSKNKKEIEEQVQTDLRNINYKGLFIVVQKAIDPWASKQQLADLAEKALTPKAIEDLNGIFLSSITTVESSQLISDKIISTVSGEMSVEKQYISRTIDNRTKFLYLVKVNVTPLKQAIQTTSKELTTSKTYLIINAVTEKDYETKLQGFGVSQDEINKIIFEVQSSQESIQLANTTASRRQADILRNGNANINKIEEEIETLKNSLTNRSSILKQIIEEKTNVVYDQSNPDKSIDNALSYLDSELNSLKRQLVNTKEQELIPRYSVSVTAEGTPAEDIAKTAIDIAGQIEQSYSKIEQFMEETIVENFMMTDYNKGQQKDVYRHLETVWLYPVAGDRDNFLLTVVVKFEIADIKGHKAGSKSIKKKIDNPNTMTDIDGNVYKTIKIGNQVWMAENLKVTHYRNGDPIPKVTDNSEWAKSKMGAYSAYENNEDYSHTHGYLYNWYTVNDSRNIAPEGWHVPSDEEWMELEIYLGMSQSDANSQGIRGEKANVGGKLKKANTNLWENPNEGATNESGFSAIASGCRLPVEATFEYMGLIASFWSSTKCGSSFMWQRTLKENCTYPIRCLGNYPKGISIRLIKDSEPVSKSISQSLPNTMTDINGNVYKTVKIGNQIWMAENIKVTRYRNGDVIPLINDSEKWSNLTTGACCVYDNRDSNAQIYGGLYNWYAINDSRNIAPEGWHVPTDEDWKQLEKYLGVSQNELDNVCGVRGTNEGGKLKETGTIHWKDPNRGATNENAFCALPAGYRKNDGEFTRLGYNAYIWSRTSFNEQQAWYRGMVYNSSQILVDSWNKRFGLSVRLIKD